MATPENEENVVLYTFGVGCFHFQKMSEIPDEDIALYFRDLENLLQQDYLIKEIKIEGHENAENNRYFSEGNYSEDGDIGDLEYIYPGARSVVLNFKISIPHRLQKEYLGNYRELLKSENFDVNIQFNDDMPVAFVVPELNEENPSSAVAILWKHMKKHLKDHNLIRFHMLGPSPFHAEFVVKSTNSQTMSVSYEPQYGYSSIEINIPKHIEKPLIRKLVEYRLLDELSLYYRMIHKRNNIIREFVRITNDIEISIENDRKRGKIARLFSREFDIYDGLIDLERLEADIQGIERFYKNEGGWIKQKFGEIALQEKFKEEIEDIKENETNPYKNILSTMKDRYAVKSTAKSTIYAAILGVIVGSILPSAGWLVSFLSKQHS